MFRLRRRLDKLEHEASQTMSDGREAIGLVKDLTEDLQDGVSFQFVIGPVKLFGFDVPVFTLPFTVRLDPRESDDVHD